MAVHEVQVFQMGVKAQFERLTYREKRYAHHLARAAWLGTRIVLQQVSPESRAIFDFILELYRSCSGDWHSLIGPDLDNENLQALLTYSATFLSNIGNYFGSGDQKFIPGANDGVLLALAGRSRTLEGLYGEMHVSVKATPPFSLGYPSDDTQSSYYLGGNISEADITAVSRILEQNTIFPENTRIRKRDDNTGFDVLLASVERGDLASLPLPDGKGTVRLVGGDYSDDLERVCAELTEASKWAANDRQSDFLKLYIESFETGSLEAYRESQRIWVRDKAPRVENIFSFVEPYRDPHGVRAEFEALVAIADDEETKLLAKLVQNSDTFIRRLPWATPENNGKGPFERDLFEPPDFSSIHALAYCSSIIFPGINLPNVGRPGLSPELSDRTKSLSQYNDIRQEDGFKNVIVANRMFAESQAKQYPFIDASEVKQFTKHKFAAYYWWVVLHELLGHGTGRMMVETTEGKFNFDTKSPPMNPITGEPISCWYKPGQTWTGVFGDLATTVDECRAELVGAYLMDDPELLELFGFNETSEIRAEDLTYNLYQQLGIDGLRGLSNFNVQSGTWGQAHSRAHFAILKCLLLHGDGVITVAHDKPKQSLTVRVQRSKIRTHGKPALERMLLQLHMFRCTADAEGCRTYYEELSKVDKQYLDWRQTVIANKPPPMIFVHANTFLDGDNVTLKEYEPTVEGVLMSWAERAV